MVALFVDTVISFTKLRIPWVSSMNTADPTVMTMSTFTGAMLKAVGIEPPWSYKTEERFDFLYFDFSL